MYFKTYLSRLKKSKFIKNFSFIYLSSLIGSTFGFLTNLLIIKFSGLDIYGKLVTLQVVTNLITKLASSRTNELTVRFIRISLEKKEYSKAKFFLVLGFITDIFTILFFWVLLKFLASTFAILFFKSSNFSSYILFQGTIESLLILRGTLLGFLTALHNFKFLAYISIFENILKLGLVIFSLLFFKNLLLKTLLVILFITTALTNIYLFIYFYISYKKTAITKVNISFYTKDMKEYLNFFIRNFIALILKAVNSRIEYLMFSYFLNTTLVGTYDFLRKLFLPYTFILQSVVRISYPRFVSMYVNKLSIKSFIFKITKYLILLYLVYITVLYLLLYKVIELLEIKVVFNYTVLLPFIILLIFLETITWWTRNFSNTINPIYSIIGNILLFVSFIFLLIVLNFLPKTETSLMLGINIIYFVVTIYWFYILKKLNI